MLSNHGEAGYTLTEVLIVLSICLVTSTFFMYNTYQFLQKENDQQAIELFQATIFNMQAHSIAHQMHTRLKFSKENDQTMYIVEDDQGNRLTEQHFPPSIHLDVSSPMKTISFQPNGDIYKFGTLILSTRSNPVRITFQFGRGRMLIYE